MLLSPAHAFARDSKELWIEQVQEIYPCRRPVKAPIVVTPRHRAVKKLRVLQGMNPIEFIQQIFDVRSAREAA